MAVIYRDDVTINAESFIDLLARSGLAERRPVDDRRCIEGMLEHANLLITAWHDDILVGVARSVTDFHYCCYLSDLAVDTACQKQGIGKRLIEETRRRLGPCCKLLLIAAPAAADYYSHIGFEPNQRCWQLAADSSLS